MPHEAGLSFAASFAPALLDPARSTPDGVTGPNGKAAGRRYDVYRNNVTVSLIDALAAIYPAVQRITGADSSAPWRVPTSEQSAGLAAAVRIRPRLPGLHGAV